MIFNLIRTFMRLHQSTDHQVIHTASAILRQSICQVFDRIVVPTPPANTLLFSQENVSDKERIYDFSCEWLIAILSASIMNPV